MKQNWGWQNRAVEALLSHNGDHFWVHAPTGTGKTNFIYDSIEGGRKNTNNIVMVGLGSVVQQHRDRFKEFGSFPLSDSEDCAVFSTHNGNLVTIATWQALSNISIPSRSVDVLFFDECHLGGGNDDNITYPKIIRTFNPERRVFLSATTQMARTTLLGARNDNAFFYSVDEAYQDGLLNPVNLVEVQVGQRVDVERIEHSLNASIDQIQEYSDEDIGRLAEKIGGEAIIDGESFIKLAARRAKAMSQIYFERHVGEQAIFYCSEIKRAKMALLAFKSRARGMNLNIRAECVHSKDPNYPSVIGKFRSGVVDVIFTVGMLQEGYDHPSLRLAFDCRFSTSFDGRRTGRMIQRIGRLTRKAAMKKTSLYYYARDITNFYNSHIVKGSFSEMKDDDISAMLIGGIISHAGDGDVSKDDVFVSAPDVEMIRWESEEEEEDQITLRSVPLFRVSDSRGHKMGQIISFRAVFGKNDSNKSRRKLSETKVRIETETREVEHPYLEFVGGMYQYSRIVPKGLRSQLKKDRIVIPLDTKDAEKAKLAADRITDDLNNEWANLTLFDHEFKHKRHTPSQYVKKKRGIYFYSRRVPKELRSQVPKARLDVSLKTRDLKVAQEKSTFITTELDRQLSGWWNIKALVASYKPKSVAPLVGDKADANECFPPITVSEACASYIRKHVARPNQQFFTITARNIDYLIECLGDMRIESFTLDHAYIFRDFLFSKNWSAATVRRVFNTVRAVINHAASDDSFENPFSRVFIPNPPKAFKITPKADLSHSDVIGNLCRVVDDEKRWLIALIIDSGLRITEALGLIKADIVLDENIPHLVVRSHPWRPISIDVHNRTVPLVGSTLWAVTRAVESSPNEFLFPTYANTHSVRWNTASATANKWLRDRLPRGIVLRSFRHSFRERLEACGTPKEMVNVIGGWNAIEYRAAKYSLTEKAKWMKRIETSEE